MTKTSRRCAHGTGRRGRTIGEQLVSRRACRKPDHTGVYGSLALPNELGRLRSGAGPMILSAIAAKLKLHSKADFKGRHYEAALIVQALS